MLFPLATGWCAQAVIDKLPAAEIAYRCSCLIAIALARSVRALLLAHPALQRRARDRVRAAQRPVRAPPAPATILLLPLAHGRPDESLRQRPDLGAADARPGAALGGADAGAVRGGLRRHARDGRPHHAAGGDPVPAVHPDRARLRPRHVRQQSGRPDGPLGPVEPSAGDDLRHLRGEGLRDGGDPRRRFARWPKTSTTASSAWCGSTARCRRSPACCRPSASSCCARGLPRDRARRDELRRVLRLLDVHHRADLPDLHHGLGVHAGAARHRLDAAHRRRALRGAGHPRPRRGAAGPGAVGGESSCATSPSAIGQRGPRAGAARRLAARPGRQRGRDRRARGRGQDHAGLADPAPLRSRRRHGLPRRHRRESHPAADPALAHRDGPAGRLPVLAVPRRQRGVRPAPAPSPRQVERGGRARAARQGRGRAAATAGTRSWASAA